MYLQLCVHGLVMVLQVAVHVGCVSVFGRDDLMAQPADREAVLFQHALAVHDEAEELPHGGLARTCGRIQFKRFVSLRYRYNETSRLQTHRDGERKKYVL